jgi:hypothetical protein
MPIAHVETNHHDDRNMSRRPISRGDHGPRFLSSKWGRGNRRFLDRRGVGRIKDPVRQQFDPIVQKEPRDRIPPDEQRPRPAERRHEESVDGDLRRENLCSDHGDPKDFGRLDRRLMAGPDVHRRRETQPRTLPPGPTAAGTRHVSTVCFSFMSDPFRGGQNACCRGSRPRGWGVITTIAIVMGPGSRMRWCMTRGWGTGSSQSSTQGDWWRSGFRCCSSPRRSRVAHAQNLDCFRPNQPQFHKHGVDPPALILGQADERLGHFVGAKSQPRRRVLDRLHHA